AAASGALATAGGALLEKWSCIDTDAADGIGPSCVVAGSRQVGTQSVRYECGANLASQQVVCSHGAAAPPLRWPTLDRDPKPRSSTTLAALRRGRAAKRSSASAVSHLSSSGVAVRRRERSCPI